MYLSKEQAKKILRNCELEFNGVHKVQGWSKYFASYRIDGKKITFTVESANPRKTTLSSLLIEQVKKEASYIKLSINTNWSGFTPEPYLVDPSGMMPLIEKYVVNQYVDIDTKKSA